jgi:hypothetical protein
MSVKKEIPQVKWNEEVIPAVKLIIETAQVAPWSIQIVGPSSEPNTLPEFGNKHITFNGLGDNGHESMDVFRLPIDFYFCKTACKLYDTVCVAVNVWMETCFKSYFSWNSDGEGEDFRSEGERLLYNTFEYDALNRRGLIKALKAKVAVS